MLMLEFPFDYEHEDDDEDDFGRTCAALISAATFHFVPGRDIRENS
jgi:hypothetical protein